MATREDAMAAMEVVRQLMDKAGVRASVHAGSHDGWHVSITLECTQDLQRLDDLPRVIERGSREIPVRIAVPFPRCYCHPD